MEADIDNFAPHDRFKESSPPVKCHEVLYAYAGRLAPSWRFGHIVLECFWDSNFTQIHPSQVASSVVAFAPDTASICPRDRLVLPARL